jgi:hypothetical protein
VSHTSICSTIYRRNQPATVMADNGKGVAGIQLAANVEPGRGGGLDWSAVRAVVVIGIQDTHR